MTASRGSFPIAFPIWVSVIPSYFARSRFSTEESITPSPPLAPYHWFSHAAAFGSSMSFLIRSRVAGSVRRGRPFSTPPSRAQRPRLLPAAVGLVRGLQMPDLRRDVRLFGHREHLVER